MVQPNVIIFSFFFFFFIPLFSIFLFHTSALPLLSFLIVSLSDTLSSFSSLSQTSVLSLGPLSDGVDVIPEGSDGGGSSWWC